MGKGWQKKLEKWEMREGPSGYEKPLASCERLNEKEGEHANEKTGRQGRKKWLSVVLRKLTSLKLC